MKAEGPPKGIATMSTDSALHHGTPAETAGVMARVGEQLRQFICSLHGHDSLKHFEDGRVSLLCASCGHESPGWDVKRRQERTAPEPRRVRLPLFGERRAA